MNILYRMLISFCLQMPMLVYYLFASICSETFIETDHQHLLLLVGFDTLIYRKYCDTPPILVGHRDYFLVLLPGSEALLKSGIGKGNLYYKCCFYFCGWSHLIWTPCLG